eukprot:TRINITY_DN8004_c0_g1_i5.p1 TRINITY_DN8004_c0_g1~~TRINITY_DN8004_c0_g1_i5.p1  ORF type:complete len:161 (-),score=25.62 TRINITY_DN8004_c0_g1_i5:127-609(-)
MNQGTYYRKHNPFMSFTDITGNLARCQKIVNETVFQADVKAGNLPEFGYYTPDINNDSHDQNLDYSGSYLQNWINSYYTAYPNSWKDVLFMITFDEDQGTAQNHIVAFFMHKCISPGQIGGSYTHYSITKWVEQNWNLGSLGQHDVDANSFNSQIPYKTC